MKQKYTRGFTLVELLTSMAIIAIILTALVAFFSQTSNASLQMSSRSDMQQETLNAQQLITGRLREAFYVLPPGQMVALSSATTANAPTYTNPVTGPRNGTTVWLTGTEPILAMILPPKDFTVTCNVTSIVVTVTGNDGCYKFYAYYPVKRQNWVAGTSNSNKPALDAPNDNAWVLVQYQAYLSTDFVTGELPLKTASYPRVIDYLNYKTATAQLLADYIQPTINDSSTTGLTNANTTYDMFTYANSSAAATITPAKPVDTVTINLATARILSGKLIRLPGPAYTPTGAVADAYPEYSITVNLTNQGKVATQQ